MITRQGRPEGEFQKAQTPGVIWLQNVQPSQRNLSASTYFKFIRQRAPASGRSFRVLERSRWPWKIRRWTLWCPHCCYISTARKHPVPDRIRPSFV